MPKSFTPMLFKPSEKQDHIIVELETTIKIGVSDCTTENELHNFIALLQDRMKTTGAEVCAISYEAFETSPYCGSLREKLIHDANYDSDEEE